MQKAVRGGRGDLDEGALEGEEGLWIDLRDAALRHRLVGAEQPLPDSGPWLRGIDRAGGGGGVRTSREAPAGDRRGSVLLRLDL